MSRRTIILVLAIALLATACSRDPGPGRVAPNPPAQAEIVDAKPFRHEGYDLLPLASYDIEARVLSVETYRFDRNAELTPVDLALGWGPMSDSDVLRHFTITQQFRTFAWVTADFPIPREEVEASAANVHVIASSPSLERKLRKLREGDVVRLEGFLVEARAADGWSWRSSLTREDSGMGACELIYVKRMTVR